MHINFQKGQTMQAEIITIGDELLIGQVIDTNSAWMAEQLNMIGIKVVQITSISDKHEAILSALADAESRADVILTTGGLGPTRDDITRNALCEFFSTKLVFDQEAFDNIERLFKSRNLRVTQLNREQAMIPEACTPLLNANGTAPGMWFEKNNKVYVSMPGVPFEMKSLMSDHVLPGLKSRNTSHIVHRTILTQGVGESFLADRIENWENSLPDFIKLAYLPQPGIVRLRLTASGENERILKKSVNEKVEELYRLIPQYIFGEGDDNLEEITGRLLREKGLNMATAESCTGGYIAHLITSIAGSSEYFKGSVVAYSNEIKHRMLGVAEDTLLTHGAVSEETVKAMANGLQKSFGVECAIAVSGIAGPGGGTDEKPVGTIWIAVNTPKGQVTRKFTFGEHRGRNIRRTALAALDMLRAELLNL